MKGSRPGARKTDAVSYTHLDVYKRQVNRWFCILFGTVSASTLVLTVFRLGRKYGPHGLMKLAAAKCRPFHIINRKRIISLLSLIHICMYLMR